MTTSPSKCRDLPGQGGGQVDRPFQFVSRFAVSRQTGSIQRASIQQKDTEMARARSHMEVTFIITTHSPHPTRLMKPNKIPSGTYLTCIFLFFAAKNCLFFRLHFLLSCPIMFRTACLSNKLLGVNASDLEGKFSNSSIYSLKLMQWSVLQFRLPWV